MTVGTVIGSKPKNVVCAENDEVESGRDADDVFSSCRTDADIVPIEVVIAFGNDVSETVSLIVGTLVTEEED